MEKPSENPSENPGAGMLFREHHDRQWTITATTGVALGLFMILKVPRQELFKYNP